MGSKEEAVLEVDVLVHKCTRSSSFSNMTVGDLRCNTADQVNRLKCGIERCSSKLDGHRVHQALSLFCPWPLGVFSTTPGLSPLD